jgi:spermidine synthase
MSKNKAAYLLFFFSGASSLIYEVLWTRSLGLILGHTVWAVTAVLCAFMGGLSLGSYLFGRWWGEKINPLRLYGLLEGIIGLYALLLPWIFRALEGLYPSLYRGLGNSFYLLSLAQFLISVLLLLLPTILMGGTLPILSQYFHGQGEGSSAKVAWLYGLNTLGAMVGTAWAGYGSLSLLGMRGSLILAVAVNGAIAAAAFALTRGEPLLVKAYAAATAKIREERPGGMVILLLAATAISGGASMVAEIAWTRALALVLGSSVYAFTTMLATFLGGLALGSIIFSRLGKGRSPRTWVLGLMQMMVGLLILATTPYIEYLPNLYLWLFRYYTQSYLIILLAQLAVAVVIMFIPALLLGASFPLLLQVLSSRGLGDSFGARWVGRAYAVNTLGAITGSALAGFLFMPYLGAQKTLYVAMGANILWGGLLIAVTFNGWRRWALAGVLLLFLLLPQALPSWDPRIMASGTAIYAQNILEYGTKDMRDYVADDELLFFKEGLSTTVSVHRDEDNIYLRVNGKTDASTSIDMHTQLMGGHLPLLLHPEPRRVLIVGLGSGVTAAAVARHPIKALDVVELEPAVVEGSRYFKSVNRGVLKDPRVKTHIADGRNFILVAPEKYDVIISEPSNPWISGVTNLFCTEYYRLCQGKLNGDGIMLQWLQGYGINLDDFKMVLKTYHSVFPYVSVWNTLQGDYLLVGSTQPQRWNYPLLRRRWQQIPGVKEDMESIKIKYPQQIFTEFIFSEKDLDKFSAAAALNTDNRPYLEFHAPKSLYLYTGRTNLVAALAAQKDPLPEISGGPDLMQWARFRYWRGAMYRHKQMEDKALEEFDRAVALDSYQLDALFERAVMRIEREEPQKAVSDLGKVLAQDPADDEARYYLAKAYKESGNPRAALPHWERLLKDEEPDPPTLLQAAETYEELNQKDKALRTYRRFLEMDPDGYEKEMKEIRQKVKDLKRELR